MTSGHQPAMRDERQRYRIWIADVGSWRGQAWHDVPPQAQALEPITDDCVTARDAMLLVEGFNRVVLERTRRVWAVAVPVDLHYVGDPSPGASIAEQAYRFG